MSFRIPKMSEMNAAIEAGEISASWLFEAPPDAYRYDTDTGEITQTPELASVQPPSRFTAPDAEHMQYLAYILDCWAALEAEEEK
jgi:hypothetical protein